MGHEKEEYLRKALLLVSNPYTKAQVQRELEDHIEDEISFYTDAGHEREKAENMAMSRMGAPEKMARELGRLHRNLPGRMLGFPPWRRAWGCLCCMGFAISGRILCMMLCRIGWFIPCCLAMCWLFWQPPPWPFAGHGSARTRCCWLGTGCSVFSVALPSIFMVQFVHPTVLSDFGYTGCFSYGHAVFVGLCT